MQLTGTVENGVVVLDNGQSLPDGTVVRIVLVEADTKKTTLGERLLKFAGVAEGLPCDMAQQLDHYLHGRPKR